jgi:hypothetical protein
MAEEDKDPNKVKGGVARAARLTPERRKEIASEAARTRWSGEPRRGRPAKYNTPEEREEAKRQHRITRKAKEKNVTFDAEAADALWDARDHMAQVSGLKVSTSRAVMVLIETFNAGLDQVALDIEGKLGFRPTREQVLKHLLRKQ